MSGYSRDILNPGEPIAPESSRSQTPGAWGLTFLYPFLSSTTQGTSDFCVTPDIYILNSTQSQISSGNVLWDLLSLEPFPQAQAESI